MVVKRAAVSLFFCGVIFPFLLSQTAFCEGQYLREGVEQYRAENYEEAIDILIKARQEDPQSSAAAFFLGMAYKQTIAYPKAAENLRAAVELTPRIKEALVELIDTLLLLEQLEEAQKWVAVAEEEEIFPAKVAFLKGMLLQKQGKNMEAIAAFEKAKELDASLAQSAELQIAVCCMKERKFKEAKKRFNAAILVDPRSDLATFARRYQDLVEQRMELEKPLRIMLQLFGSYDTNVVLDPGDPSFVIPTGQTSAAGSSSLRVDYVPILEGPWLFNLNYSLFANFYSDEIIADSHDAIVNSIYVVPGYNFGKWALNLAARYDYVLVRNLPNYETFTDRLNAGPLFRTLINTNQILEVFGGYLSRNYRPRIDFLAPEEDRDATGLNAYVSWIWPYKRGGLVNLRYDFEYEDAKGLHWENDAHIISANGTIPLIDNLSLQLNLRAAFRDYKNARVMGDFFAGIEREDHIYDGTVTLRWEFLRNRDLIAQFSRTVSNSNVAIFDYDRNIYTLGVELRF